MAKRKSKLYPQAVIDLMAKKTAILSKAQALSAMGMPEIAVALWATAATYEERLAPLLEVVARNQEAAVHRISAASCYQKAGEPSRAVNLYRAALAGPLPDATRREVEAMLSDCLAELTEVTLGTPA